MKIYSYKKDVDSVSSLVDLIESFSTVGLKLLNESSKKINLYDDARFIDGDEYDFVMFVDYMAVGPFTLDDLMEFGSKLIEVGLVPSFNSFWIQPGYTEKLGDEKRFYTKLHLITYGKV